LLFIAFIADRRLRRCLRPVGQCRCCTGRSGNLGLGNRQQHRRLPDHGALPDFQFAHDRTNNNGAINVLSSGNFGPLIITKPGTDNRGIGFASGAALHVQDCVIRRASNGILFLVFSGTSELYVADTVVANSDANGIIVAPSGSGSAKPVFDRVRVENGLGHGFSFSGSGTTGSITATVSDSVAAGHGNTGIFANVGAGTTTVMIDRSASVNNATGIRVRTSIQFPGGAATARIGDSTVSGKGWTQS
jgi:hypothetical protein